MRQQQHVMRLPLSQIEVPTNRLRKMDMKVVTYIAEDLRPDGTGLINPILVWKRGDGSWVLIAGEHRYNAAKAAGWSDIPSLQWDRQLANTEDPDEIVELRARFVEAAENMKRKEMTAADFDYTAAALIDAQRKLDTLAQELQRKRDREEAEAKVKAAADEKARKKAKAELEAVKARERMRKPKENFSDSKNPSRNPHGSKTVEKVADEIGVSKHAVQRSQHRHNAVNGADLRGTSLATEPEMLAFGELRKLAPHEADDVLKNALQGYKVSALATLTTLKAQAKAAADAETVNAARNNRDEALLLLNKGNATLKGMLLERQRKVKELNLQADVTEFAKMYELLEKLEEKVRQVRRTKAPAGGKGGRAYAVTNPEDSKKRAQAKKDQAANATLDIDTLKKVVR